MVHGHVPGQIWNICLYRTLPMQQKSRLLSCLPTHAYTDCKISGQQPRQLQKKVPGIYYMAMVIQKNDAHLKSQFCSSTNMTASCPPTSEQYSSGIFGQKTTSAIFVWTVFGHRKSKHLPRIIVLTNRTGN